ncbi:UDP-glucuronic acid decarboxylase family protein [Nonomuraea sp. NPDC048901]|uniref:UDP-glucuronic acid decarboxylase family protein n=1 Tax=Nonomuraea sp. NPDC048901 TaxID=3155627 RepID=UPI0033D3C469
MTARRAVVTGGAGFLGSHICERLLHESYEVVCIDNFCTGSPGNVAHLLKDDVPFQLVDGDVTRPQRIDGRVDAVLHFASPASPTDYLRMPIQTLKVGSLATLHALDLAEEKGARFVLASTSEVYGDPQVHPQPESYWGHVNPIGPRGVYDEAKRFAEAMTVAYGNSHGVNVGIARIFNTHGPRMRLHDGRAIPTFVRQALLEEPITVSGDGSQTRSIQYVDDLVEGVWRLLRSRHTGPINLGNPHEISIRGLAELVRKLIGSRSPLVYVSRPQDDPCVRRPDITLCRTLLGWEPRVTLDDGLNSTIEYFRDVAAALP